MSWLGGPAVGPLAEWPRRTEGRALAHVATIHLGNLDATTDSEGKAGWPLGQLRKELPTDSVLEVFHDLESFGYHPADGAARGWRVRWVRTPDRSVLIDPPQDLDTPTDVCRSAYGHHPTVTKQCFGWEDMPAPTQVMQMKPVFSQVPP